MDVLLTPPIQWTAERVKKLRGKRTQEEFGRLIRVPKNTVWRWGAGYAKTGAERGERLFPLAKKKKILQDWELGGTAEILRDLQKSSQNLRESFDLAWLRGLRQQRS